MAEKQARKIAQEKAKKTRKAKNTENEITNLLTFKKEMHMLNQKEVINECI